MTVGTTLRTLPGPTPPAASPQGIETSATSTSTGQLGAPFSSRTFRAMGTDVQLVLRSSRQIAQPLLDFGQARIEELEQCLSRFRKDSELCELNAHAGDQTIVSPMLFRFISAARQAWVQSEGLFDPTMGMDIAALGYDKSFEHLPPLAVKNAAWASLAKPKTLGARTEPQHGHLALDPVGPTVHCHPSLELDLGGIAKGLAADIISAELIERGAAGCCVNVGGDLRVRGDGPEHGGTWMVGLDCPGSAQRRSIWLKAGAVCTSTVTERRWEGADGPAHHVLDPESRQPTHSRVLSATVLGREAAACEVLATIALVGGSETGADRIAAAGSTGLLVTNNGAMEQLPGIARFLARRTSTGELATEHPIPRE